MSILAFDTCFGACSVAVRWRTPRGEVLLREEYEERETGHAEALMPMIERVMTSAGLSFQALDRIAVTTGPGSFTGARLGVAAARGLALAADSRPIVTASSLAVIAFRADALLRGRRGERPLLVAVDARRGQVYAQLFGENAGDPLSEPLLLTPGAACALAAERPFTVVGSGAGMVREAAAAAEAACEVLHNRLEPHARYLALLGQVLAPVDSVRPLYLRAPDAVAQVGAAVARVP